MRTCVFCKTRYEKGSGITFHKFPKDSSLKQWLKKMKFVNQLPKNSDHLCSKHFTHNCFIRHETRIALKRGSIPTIFSMGSSEHKDLPEHGSLESDTTSTDQGDSVVEQGSKQDQDSSFSSLSKNCNQEQTTTPKKAQSISEACFTIKHDHTYGTTPRTFEKFRESLQRVKQSLRSTQTGCSETSSTIDNKNNATPGTVNVTSASSCETEESITRDPLEVSSGYDVEIKKEVEDGLDLLNEEVEVKTEEEDTSSVDEIDIKTENDDFNITSFKKDSEMATQTTTADEKALSPNNEGSSTSFGECHCCLKKGMHSTLYLATLLECLNVTILESGPALVCVACEEFIQRVRQFRDLVAYSQRQLAAVKITSLGEQHSTSPGEKHSGSLRKQHSASPGEQDSASPGEQHSASPGEKHSGSLRKQHSAFPEEQHSKSLGKQQGKPSGVQQSGPPLEQQCGPTEKKKTSKPLRVQQKISPRDKQKEAPVLKQSGISSVERKRPPILKKKGRPRVQRRSLAGVQQSGAQGVQQSGLQGVQQSGPQGVQQSGPQGVQQSGPQGVQQSGPQGVQQSRPLGEQLGESPMLLEEARIKIELPEDVEEESLKTPDERRPATTSKRLSTDKQTTDPKNKRSRTKKR